jgi:hypothetical protein
MGPHYYTHMLCPIACTQGESECGDATLLFVPVLSPAPPRFAYMKPLTSGSTAKRANPPPHFLFPWTNRRLQCLALLSWYDGIVRLRHGRIQQWPMPSSPARERFQSPARCASGTTQRQDSFPQTWSQSRPSSNCPAWLLTRRPVPAGHASSARDCRIPRRLFIALHTRCFSASGADAELIVCLDAFEHSLARHCRRRSPESFMLCNGYLGRRLRLPSLTPQLIHGRPPSVFLLLHIR